MVERDVHFLSDDVTLCGTFTIPDGAGAAPTVLMLPGSGQTDRDDNAKKLAINLFPQLAEMLDACGFATLRYDKRGVGASGGDYWSSGFEDRLTDAAAALRWLAPQEQVDRSRLFVLGHSEGALVAIRLAAGAASIAGAVLLAGSAKSGNRPCCGRAPRSRRR